MTMLRPWFVLPLIGLALAGCESTGRFGSNPFNSRPAPVVAAVPATPDPIVAAPTAPVQRTTLPPVAAEPLPSTQLPSTQPTGAPLTQAEISPLDPPGQQVAAVEPPPPSVPKPATASSRGVSGTWSVTDVGRGKCSILLTNSPLLDLYRAKPNGCTAGSLAKVNAWQQRGQEVVLLEPGGRTAVRLFPKGDGTYEGAATTSGVVVRMTR